MKTTAVKRLALLAALVCLMAAPAAALAGYPISLAVEIREIAVVYEDGEEKVDLNAAPFPDIIIDPSRAHVRTDIMLVNPWKVAVTLSLNDVVVGQTYSDLIIRRVSAQQLTVGGTYTLLVGVANPVPVNLRLTAPPTAPPNTSTGAAHSASDDLPEGQAARIGNVKAFAPVYEEDSVRSSVIGQAYLGETVYLRRWNANETMGYIIYNSENNAGWVEGRYIVP